MAKVLDLPAIQAVAKALLHQCEQLATAVEAGDSEALIGERMRACHRLAERLFGFLWDSYRPAGDFSNILAASLPDNQRTALASLRERLDRIFHPSNFRGPRGEIVDPLTAPAVAFHRPGFREWADVLRPAVTELDAARLATDGNGEAAESRIGESANVSPTKARAFQAFVAADKANPGSTKRDLYKWLQSNGDEFDPLPPFETWARYVRGARRTAKRTTADGR